jgi:hypothetical protein
MYSLPTHIRSISSNLVELLAVDCTDEEAIQELRVLVNPTVKWVKTSHTPRSGRLNATVGGAGTGTGMYGNFVDNMKLNGTGSNTNRYTNNYNNKNNSNNNSNSNSRSSYGKPSTNYGNNEIASNAVSGAPSSSVAGATNGLGDDNGLSLGKQSM